MADYDRKIRYLDYCERGERRFGAGFVKLENRSSLCSISLQISGLRRHDRFTAPLYLLTSEGERELTRLQFADGCVRTCMERLPAQDLDGNGLEYDALLGLRVPIAEGREIRCVWSKTTGQDHPQDQDSPQEEKTEAEQVNPTYVMDPSLVVDVKQAAESAEVVPEKKQPTKEPPQEQPAAPQEAVFYGDKWQQLFSIYPQTHPFEDDRVYLSIGLGDFVLLSAKSYPLVNNSFLLHGFYSYGHLILARMQNRSGLRFYIGVPGSYHERERRVAVMFGFENFECRREPAREGDFGYYMIPVEL